MVEITRNGEVLIDGVTVIKPGMSEEKFTKSPYGSKATFEFANQGYSTYHLIVEQSSDGGLGAAMLLIFKDGIIKKVHFGPLWEGMPRSWSEWSLEGEMEIKRKNDLFLKENLGKPPYQYEWGRVDSIFDRRDAVSDIIVTYKHPSP